MIPAFDGHVLPPFTAGDEVGAHDMPRSPYPATMTAVVQRFATSPDRGRILSGLLRYRAALRDAGFVEGAQWIDGSFVEDCERAQGRPPNDVDVVTLIRRPTAVRELGAWHGFIQANAALFNQAGIKAEHLCDSYFIDLDLEPTRVVAQTAYWFGLFSHQRTTFRWKGLVQLNLICDDLAAEAALAERSALW